MTTICVQLVRTIRSASRPPSSSWLRQSQSLSRTAGQLQLLSRTAGQLQSRCSLSTSVGGGHEPRIESLEDLENMLNVPAYGNRGDEFNKALQLEYDFFKYNGQLVPDVMTDEMWEEIRGLKTVEDRLELYRFLQIKERYKEKQKGRTRKGEYAEKRRRALLADIMGGMDKVPGDIYDEKGYSLLGPTVTICRKIDDTLVKQIQTTHLPYALNFGQPLVFDLGVDYQMSNFEGSNFIAQMKEMYGSNRSHWEPYNLYLCNYNPRNVIQRKLVESKHTEKWLWNVTRRCFTDVFPKEKIVYLTSRSRVPLSHYRHDAVYVIGACVDSRPGKDEMSKVKEMGLQHAYFDLRPYFTKKGSSSIPINQVFRALQDQRDCPNLHYAYRHFSRRRFTYRERAMNRIIVEQEQAFVNKRAILLPKIHDVNKYELQPERHYDDDEEDEDEDGEDGEYRDRRDHHHHQHGRFPPRRHTRDYDDLEPDRTRRRSRPFTTRDHMERRMTRDELDQDHEDEDFQLDPATPKRNSIIDY